MDRQIEEMVNLAMMVQNWKEVQQQMVELKEEVEYLKGVKKQLEMNIGDELLTALQVRANYRINADENGR